MALTKFEQEQLNKALEIYEKLQDKVIENGRLGSRQQKEFAAAQKTINQLTEEQGKATQKTLETSKELTNQVSKLSKHYRKISASNKDRTIIGLKLKSIEKDLVEQSGLLIKSISKHVEGNKINADLGKELGMILEENASNLYDTEGIQQKLLELQQQKIDGVVEEDGELRKLNQKEQESIDLTIKKLKQRQKALNVQSMQKKAQDAHKKAVEKTGAALGLSLTSPLALALSLLKLFSAATDAIGKKFGALGVVNFRNQLASARAEFVGIGLAGDDALTVVGKLSTEFGVTFQNAINAAEAVGEFAKATGLGVDEATSLVGLLMQTQGMSEEIAVQTLKQTQALAMANGVAPGAVLRDMAKSTETFAKFTKEGGKNLLEAAVQARKLGLEIDTIGNTAEGLLDFQNSLNAEIEAGILLGRRLNLQKARELALANDMTGLQQELLNIVGDEAEFNEMNLFQRRALAKALNMSVFQLQKLVSSEKEAVTLAGELAKTDISDLVSENAISKTAELINNLKKIGMEIAEKYGPTIEKFVAGFLNMVLWLEDSIGLMPILIGYMTIMVGKSIVNMVAALATAYASGAKWLGPGAIAALVAAPFVIGGLVTTLMSLGRDAGDVMSPANGQTQISTKEGELLNLSKNDDVAAAPGLLDALKPKTNYAPIWPMTPFEMYHGAAHKPLHDYLANQKGAGKKNIDYATKDSATTELSNREQTKALKDTKHEVEGLRKDMASYFGFGGTMQSNGNTGTLSAT